VTAVHGQRGLADPAGSDNHHDPPVRAPSGRTVIRRAVRRFQNLPDRGGPADEAADARRELGRPDRHCGHRGRLRRRGVRHGGVCRAIVGKYGRIQSLKLG
jgi:hypothetical protein